MLIVLIVLFFSNYFYGSYKINASDVGIKSTDSKINFKIVTAGLELSEFKEKDCPKTKFTL